MGAESLPGITQGPESPPAPGAKAPYQMFRGTSARCLREYDFSTDKVAGDSALVSPKMPESPPLQE